MAQIDRDKVPAPYLWFLDKIEPTGILVFQMHMTVFWLLSIPVSLIWFKDSILWIIAISIWANISSHSVGAILQFLESADDDGNLH